METFETINQWQRDTFPNATVEGILNHIEEEINEFQTAPTEGEKRLEAADLIILLSAWLDATRGRTGLELNLYGAQTVVDYKMMVNRKREWNIQPDGTGRHV